MSLRQRSLSQHLRLLTECFCSEVAYDLISSRQGPRELAHEWTVGDIHRVLGQLHQVSKAGDELAMVEQRGKILKECMAAMTPEEMRWLVSEIPGRACLSSSLILFDSQIRIILKGPAYRRIFALDYELTLRFTELKIGLTEIRVLNTIHPRGMSLYNTNMDLKRTLRALMPLSEVEDEADEQVQVSCDVALACCQCADAASRRSSSDSHFGLSTATGIIIASTWS